jgi:hypothetical protein
MEALQRIYDDLGAPNARQLRFAALRENVEVTRKQVEEFLSTKSERQQFRQPNLSSGKTAVRGPGESLMIDLITLNQFGTDMFGTKNVLFAMDPFNRKIALEQTNDKRPATVAQAFRRILQRMPTPVEVSSDNGSEFKHVFDQMLNELNIVHKFRRGINSLGRMDNGIKSIKRQISQRVLKKEKVDGLLSRVEESYNKSLHSALGMSPNDAAKDDKQGRIEQFHLMKENAEAFEHNHDTAKKKMDSLREQGAFRVQDRSTFQRSFKPRFGEKKEVANVERTQVTDTSGKTYNVNEVIAIPVATVDNPQQDFSGRNLRDTRLRTILQRYADELYERLTNTMSLTSASRSMSDQFFETKPTHISFSDFLKLFPSKFALQGQGPSTTVRRVSRRLTGKQSVR